MKPSTRKPSKLKTTIAIALTACVSIGSAFAGDKQTYTDFGRVVHVEPAYRYITIKTPQRVCTPRSPHYRDNHSNRRHDSHASYSSDHSYRRDSTGAIFIGGLIGGAIGREVSKSVNGRSSTGATIAGTIIGSTLANAASHSNRQYQPARHDRGYRTHQQRHQGHNNRNHHNRGHHNQRRQHRNQHRNQHHQRCTTTTQTSRERRADGYNVTYTYRGQTFNTHTHHHPGNRIQLDIVLRPQR